MPSSETKHPPRNPPMARLNRFAWLMDNSIRIPGTRWRIGIDPLIGLIPGIGDALAALLSLVIVGEAARARLPTSVLARMAFNLGLEVLIGAIPLIGDIFDMTWKANARNVHLMERYMASPQPTVASSRIMMILVAVVLLVVIAAAGLVGFMVLKALWNIAIG